MSRRTKKLLKAYGGWKAVKAAAKFGLIPAAGAALFHFIRSRDRAEAES